MAEAAGGDDARLGMGRRRGARGCVEAVEVWQGEGERRGVGRATRNVVNIGTHVDVTLGDGGDEGVQGQNGFQGDRGIGPSLLV